MKKLVLTILLCMNVMPLSGMSYWDFEDRRNEQDERKFNIDVQLDKLLKKLKQQENQDNLFVAVKKGDSEAVTALLKEGVNVNAYNHKGLTPLCVSLEKKHTDVSKLLIANGAQVTVYASASCSPLHIAINNEDLDGVTLLLNHPDIDLNIGKEQEGVLYYALNKDDRFHGKRYDILKLLVNHKNFDPRQLRNNEEGSVFYMVASKVGFECYHPRVGYKERLSNAVALTTVLLKNFLKKYTDRQRVAELLFIGRNDKSSSLSRLPNDMICRILSYVSGKRKEGVSQLRAYLELTFQKGTALNAMVSRSKYTTKTYEAKKGGCDSFINQMKELLDSHNAEKTYEAITKYKHASVRAKNIVQPAENQIENPKKQLPRVSSKQRVAPKELAPAPHSASKKESTRGTSNSSSGSLPRYMQPTQSKLLREKDLEKK